MRKDSLVAANDRGRIRATHVTAQLHRPLRLRVKVYTDKAHDEFSHVLIYDGDPDKGGRMVASKVVHRREGVVEPTHHPVPTTPPPPWDRDWSELLLR